MSEVWVAVVLQSNLSGKLTGTHLPLRRLHSCLENMNIK